MQYMLLLHHDDTPFAAASPQDQEKMSAPYMAYNEALIKAGAMVSGERLQGASSATTVRVRDGKTEVLDGPFAATKEQLGGFYIIEAPDLDAALNWAARCPSANYGTVEVRPIWPTR
ncbi:YciI family protein [Aminobacter anthyllidis]|uniref:YciI family protein n=1 Tax=Aminobacter anthyllidis TaxID=1035067 RepID=A0A9X1AE86_9HYPH|nr:YciI family protein [Aminobacter anthyllidis]MBT1158289.1 YciI family protein [Aminobacter anthyllidis]MDH4986450.1 YciI family protein [Aminobacter anthyllidis]